MAAANLQTIIVSKTVAKTRAKAQRLAEPHARRIYTSRETESSWRFRQRPPSDFKKSSFRTFPLPGHRGITLVYGDLKASKGGRKGNPRGRRVVAGRQRHLQYVGKEGLEDINRDWDFWLEMQGKISRARSKNMIQVLALSTRRRRIQSETIKGLIMGALADRARELRFLRSRPTSANDENYYNELVGDNPKRKTKKKAAKKKTVEKEWETTPKELRTSRRRPVYGSMTEEGHWRQNPKKKAAKKKRAKKGSGVPKAKKLRAPKVMPDPGPSAWCGSTLEFAFKPNGKKPRWVKLDEKGNWLWEGGLKREWLFLWSPKYKAVVAVPRPRGLKGGVGRQIARGEINPDGGGAKMFERFSARAPDQTQDVDIPEIPLQKLGEAVHIVYRADKWSTSRKTTDYIHDFKDGVRIYCGPSAANPKVFLCFGGKLTMTERGLVF